MAAVIAGCSTTAMAAFELQIDVNSLTSQVMAGADANDMYYTDAAVLGDGTPRGAGFGTNFTGSIAISDDATSILAGILIDGLAQTVTGTLGDFVGQIDFTNGAVDGGFFSVTVVESDAVTMNTYSAQIVSGVGQIDTQAGQGFSINGLTFMGFFSSDLFAGVDVSQWNAAEPLSGSFIHFKFNPDANGIDADSDVDIFVVVPLPTAPALAGVGLVGLLAGTRRRRVA